MESCGIRELWLRKRRQGVFWKEECEMRSKLHAKPHTEGERGQGRRLIARLR